MKQPTFLEGVAVALVASITGSAIYAVMAPMLGGYTLLRLLIAGLGFGYLLYLLTRTSSRTGRVSAVLLWAVSALALWILAPPLAFYMLAHVGLVWFLRSLYFYSGVLSALVDLGLSGLSLVGAVWAFAQSGSLFLSIWSLFLVQALFVVIPARIGTKAEDGRAAAPSDDPFARAHVAAQAALRKISSIR